MKNASKIIASLTLLLTFLTGQVIVFAHSHQAVRQFSTHYAQKDKAKIAEDCPICVQHGNVQLLLQQQNTFHYWAISSSYTQVPYTAIYQSIQLLLSGNRGPPAV